MQRPRQVTLITGASSGIGAAIAATLHGAGHRVWGASRRVVEGEIPWVACDVTDAAAVAEAVARVQAAEGRIDAVVACAGWGIAGSVEDTSDAEARAQFDTNFFGALNTVRAVLPGMRAQGAGRIVAIGSIGGRIAVPFQGLYSASKFALEGAMEALRHEVRPFGIHVSIIEPGDFATGFTAARVRAAAAGPGSAYAAAADRAIGQMERDERNGPPPAEVAALVARVLASPRPKLRYRVGPAMQRAAVSLKAVLPEAAFEALIRGAYGLG